MVYPAEDSAYLYVGTGTGLYGQRIVLTEDARRAIEGDGGLGTIGGVPLSALIGGIAAVIVVGGVATFLLLRRRGRPRKLIAVGAGDEDLTEDVTMRLDNDDIDVDDM